MFKYSKIMIVMLFSSFILPSKAENVEKMKRYALLIEEGKQHGMADLLIGITPENIEKKLLYARIQSNKETEEKLYHFQIQIRFIERTELYPSLNNLIEVALSEKQYNKNSQIIALRLLISPYTNLEKARPSVEQVEDFLQKCNDVEIIIEAVPLLARLDHMKGFATADTIISNKEVSLKDKMNLSLRLMPFAYTGGYVILQKLAKSNDAQIKLNAPMLINYYEQYNGKKVTNSEIIIDTTSIKIRMEE